ncbi:MAG TPA: septum formation initiator family protein [Amnibacterium sp.]|jgi:cell division protein FtsB|nr:septum formation initiator family protein [Amnibacterium sp.]
MTDAAGKSAPSTRRRLTLVGGPLSGVRIPGLAVAAIVLLVFAVVSLAPQAGTYLRTQQQLTDTAAKVASQERNLQQLDADVARWNDPAYIRSQAGSRLFYVLPGETTYRVVGLPATPPGTAAAPSRTVQQTRTNWLDGLLGSVVTAGTTESPHPTTAPAGG